jgi:hypothetical protein
MYKGVAYQYMSLLNRPRRRTPKENIIDTRIAEPYSNK